MELTKEKIKETHAFLVNFGYIFFSARVVIKDRIFFTVCFILIFSYSAFSQTTFTSTTSGNWDDGGTWGNISPGIQGTDWPATTDNAVIAIGHTVTMTGAETINDLTINSGGVLDDDNKGDITVNGNLTINGTVTGDKNIQFTGGSGEIIDGTGVHNSTKDIVVNGTASIASAASLTIISNFEITGSTTVTNNGTVIINTDLKGASATWVNAANSTLKVGRNLLNGGGTLTAAASGNTVLYNRDGAQTLKTPSASTYYNLTIEGTGTKTIPSDLTISGSLTITSGTFDTGTGNLTIGGDFTNSGSFTEVTNTVTFNGTGTQTITNSSGETFYNLTINKASGTLILANDVVVSNTLTMTAGITDAGSNKLTLGTGTGNEGTYSYTAGQIIGQFERWVANTTTGTDIDFPVGTTGNSRIVTINFVGITTGGTVLFQFVGADPGNAGLSLDDGGTTIYNTFVDGYWDMETANSFNLGPNTFDLDLAGTGFTAFTIDAATRLLTRTTAASDWTAEGTHVAAVDPTAMRTGLSTMPAQYAFGDDTNCTGPVTSSITGSTEVCTDDTGVSYSVTDNSNTYTWTITGGTQVSGGTTASITVDWGSTGLVGNVKVVETNGCTSGTAVILSVNVNSIAPSSIIGKINVAESTQDEPYSVTDLGYSYTWTIMGGTLDTGNGTNSITVDWGTAGTGNVSVVAQKSGCTEASAVDTDVTKYIVINSAQTGNWATGSTWVTGTVPLSTENARVLISHTVTFTANQTIANLIVAAGGTLSTTNKIMTVNGDLTVDGIYSGGSKQLILNGSNVTIDGTGTITLNSGVDIDISTGNKTISSTAVLSITQGDLKIAAGITVTNNGSISVTEDVIGTATSVWTNSTNSTLKAGKALLTTGTLNASASGNTVNYNGSGAQSIKTPGSSNYYNLILSTSGTKTALVSLDIDGDLTISGTATFDVSVNSADLTVAGNWVNSGGTFTEGTRTVTLDGTAAQQITGSETFNNLVINNSVSGDAITLNSPVTITSALTLTDGIVLTTSTNKLSMGSAGIVSGFSDGSFINGPMAYNSITSNTVTFPVGKDSELHRFDLTVNGTSSNYTAEYIHSSAVALGRALPGTLDKVSDIGYWTITRDAGGSVTTAAVDLYYNSNDVVSDAPNLRVAKDDGAGNWVDLGGTGSGSPTGNILSVTNFTTFSDFSLANNSGGGNALPIKLLYFRAIAVDRIIRLEWMTAAEINNDFYTVERSKNAVDFEEMLEIASNGDSNELQEYAVFDERPYQGLSYYRLKQTDFDGTFTYSDIVSVSMKNNDELLILSVFPNPTNGKILNLTTSGLNQEEHVLMQIISVYGKPMLSEYFYADDRGEINIQIPPDINNWSDGFYIITLYTEKGLVQGRIIKK